MKMLKKMFALSTCAALGLALALPAAAEETKSADGLTTASAAGTQPLEISLPKPLFVGTPKDIKSKNLEKPHSGKRPTYNAPEGTVLLSAGKTVTGSEESPVVGTLELITDKDKEGTDGSFVELGWGKQYVQIDLEKPARIAAIAIWHYHQDARVYRDVIVQVSDDPDFITGVTTVFNNDDDNTAGLGAGKDKEYIETYEGKLIDAKGAKGRYVRLYSNGNTANDMSHYIEVEVYGKPL